MERVFAVIETTALGLWVGALAAFAFVFAPVAFRVISDVDRFGALIGAVLGALNIAGYVCGAVALVAIFARGAGTPRLSRNTAVRALAVVAMLLLVVAETTLIIPAMHGVQSTLGGSLAKVAASDPRRVHYDRLHALSTGAYAVVLILGVTALALSVLAQPKGERHSA